MSGEIRYFPCSDRLNVDGHKVEHELIDIVQSTSRSQQRPTMHSIREGDISGRDLTICVFHASEAMNALGMR